MHARMHAQPVTRCDVAVNVLVLDTEVAVSRFPPSIVVAQRNKVSFTKKNRQKRTTSEMRKHI